MNATRQSAGTEGVRNPGSANQRMSGTPTLHLLLRPAAPQGGLAMPLCTLHAARHWLMRPAGADAWRSMRCLCTSGMGKMSPPGAWSAELQSLLPPTCSSMAFGLTSMCLPLLLHYDWLGPELNERDDLNCVIGDANVLS